MSMRLLVLAASAMVLGLGPAVAQSEFGSAELIEAAKKEGRLVFYTANFAEVEQEVIKAFNKRFPEVCGCTCVTASRALQPQTKSIVGTFANQQGQNSQQPQEGRRPPPKAGIRRSKTLARIGGGT